MRILMVAVLFVLTSTAGLVAAPAPAPAVGASDKAVDAFTQRMAEVAALEAAGDFRKAMLSLRRMRQEFREGRQVLAVDDAMERVRGLSEAGVGATDALTQLGSEDSRVVDVTRRQLLNSGVAGLIMLRKAIQTGTAVAAANAAEAVVEAKDSEAVPVLLQRLQGEKGRTPLALAIMKALGRMQSLFTIEQLAEIDKILESAEGASRCEIADVLQAALEKRADGKAEGYEKLIGRPGAYERLRETFSRAIASGDEVLINWACREGTLFLPSVRGFRATYYSDPGFVNTAMERFEPTIEKKNEESFPYPNGQSNTLSVSWQADLVIAATGVYTFCMAADDTGNIFLDGSNIVSTWGGQGLASQPMNMTVGVYRIKVGYVQERDAGWYKVWWNGPGFQDLVNLPVSTRPMPDQMIKLVRSLNDLTSTNWTVSRAVKDRVLAGGEAGMMVLRDAVAKREEPLAIAAMEFLSSEQDPRMIPSLIRRARDANLSPLLRQKIADALRRSAFSATDADCRALIAGLAGEGGLDKRLAMVGLCAVLDRACGGREAAFNKRCGKPDAHAVLKTFVDSMYDSKEQEDALWLAAFGQPFVLAGNGLYARYWRGSRNDEFVLERMDNQLDFYDRIPPMTDGGNKEFSAAWEGVLSVPVDGEYKFYLRGQNDAKVWLDDELLISNTYRGHEPLVARKLAKGAHRVRGMLRFWNDSPAMHLQWEGPGIQKQFVPVSCLSAAPSMSAVANAIAGLTKLPGLSNADVALPIHRSIRALGGAAVPVLLQAISDGEEPVAAEAIAILLELPKDARDSRAASVLVARSEKVSSAALRNALARGLRETAGAIPEADCKRMLATLKSGEGMDKGIAMAGLCAVLDRACGGKAEEFNKRCGEAEAYETTKTAVAQGLSAKDVNEIAWATSFGQPFAPLMGGVRARYWRGSQFDMQVIDRREERIEQMERIPGITDQNPVELSARWEGYLNVPADGEYRFSVAIQNEGKIWIDEKQVITHTGHRHQETGQTVVKLAAGKHLLKAELRFWNDWPGMRIWWEGPNLPKQIVAAPYLGMNPMSAAVLAAAKSLGKMRGLDNEAEYMTCRRNVQALGMAAGPMLRSMVRDGLDSPAATEALRFLIEMNDPATVPLLVDQIKTNQALRVNPFVMDTMVQLASSADTNTLIWCLGEVRQAKAPDVDACLAVLCRVFLNTGGGDPGPFNRLVKDPKGVETIKTAVAAALDSPDRKAMGRALRYGQPFAPFVGGATARYYFGDRFDKLHGEKQEWDVRLWEYRGLPGWRDANVSALYDGFINAPQAGDFVFRINARGEGTLSLDGKQFMSVAAREDAKTINMSAGFHPFRFALRQPAQDFAFSLDTDRTPMNGQRVRVDGTLVVSPPSAGLIAALERAAGELDDKDPVRVSAARALLNNSGEVGMAFLRNLALNAPEKKAASVAGMIISQRPPDAAKILLSMMRKNPKSETMPTLVAALAAVTEQIQPADALWIYDGTFDTTGLTERQQLQLLAAVADRACLGDKGLFQALLKSKGPQVWDTVAQRFTTFIDSLDTNNVFWALQYGGPFVPRVTGIRGRFYEGQAFDRAYADMREDCVDRKGEPFHGRGNPLSAWWTGSFEVKQAGRFKLGLRADDNARLWVDGRLVVDGWTSGTGQNLAGETDLSVGWHAFDVRYRQSEGDRYVFASIQGPGMNGRFDKSFVWCAPPPGIIAALYKELEKLGIDNQVQEGLNAAGQWRPVSDLFLRNMVRVGPPKQAERAAGLLSDWRDVAAKPLILKRAASTPDANLRKALEEAAKRIP